eukprot:tig00020710_g13225.t1
MDLVAKGHIGLRLVVDPSRAPNPAEGLFETLEAAWVSAEASAARRVEILVCRSGPVKGRTTSARWSRHAPLRMNVQGREVSISGDAAAPCILNQSAIIFLGDSASVSLSDLWLKECAVRFEGRGCRWSLSGCDLQQARKTSCVSAVGEDCAGSRLSMSACRLRASKRALEFSAPSALLSIQRCELNGSTPLFAGGKDGCRVEVSRSFLHGGKAGIGVKGHCSGRAEECVFWQCQVGVDFCMRDMTVDKIMYVEGRSDVSLERCCIRAACDETSALVGINDLESASVKLTACRFEGQRTFDGSRSGLGIHCFRDDPALQVSDCMFSGLKAAIAFDGVERMVFGDRPDPGPHRDTSPDEEEEDYGDRPVMIKKPPSEKLVAWKPPETDVIQAHQLQRPFHELPKTGEDEEEYRQREYGCSACNYNREIGVGKFFSNPEDWEGVAYGEAPNAGRASSGRRPPARRPMRGYGGDEEEAEQNDEEPPKPVSRMLYMIMKLGALSELPQALRAYSGEAKLVVCKGGGVGAFPTFEAAWAHAEAAGARRVEIRVRAGAYESSKSMKLDVAGREVLITGTGEGVDANGGRPKLSVPLEFRGQFPRLCFVGAGGRVVLRGLSVVGCVGFFGEKGQWEVDDCEIDGWHRSWPGIYVRGPGATAHVLRTSVQGGMTRMPCVELLSDGGSLRVEQCTIRGAGRGVVACGKADCRAEVLLLSP